MKALSWLSDRDYNFIYSRVPRLCVDLVIKTKQGILFSKRLIQPYKGTWHLPGGRVYFKEPITKALQRVARAEIGGPVTIRRFIGFLELLREVQDKKARHSVSLVFLATPVKNNFSSSWQAEKIRLFKSLPKNVLAIHGGFLKTNKILN